MPDPPLMRELTPQPKQVLRPANKYSYQSIFLFLWLGKNAEKKQEHNL